MRASHPRCRAQRATDLTKPLSLAIVRPELSKNFLCLLDVERVSHVELRPSWGQARAQAEPTLAVLRTVLIVHHSVVLIVIALLKGEGGVPNAPLTPPRPRPEPRIPASTLPAPARGLAWRQPSVRHTNTDGVSGVCFALQSVQTQRPVVALVPRNFLGTSGASRHVSTSRRRGSEAA